MPKQREVEVLSLDAALKAAEGQPHYEGLIRHGRESVVNREDLVRNVMQRVEATSGPIEGVTWTQTGGLSDPKRRLYLPVCARELDRQRQSTRELCDQLEILNSRMAVLNLLSGAPSYGVYDEVKELLRAAGCTVLPASGADADDYILRTVRRFKANTVVATPARLVQFAWYIGSQGIQLPLPNIILYGDVVRDCHFDAFNKAFGEVQYGKELHPRVSAIYGVAELGILGFSPHQLRDPRSIIYDSKVLHVEIAECTPEEIAPSVDERWAEVHENQRKYPMVGWKGKMIKGDPPQWTATDTGEELRKEKVPLPSPEWGQWAFDGDWQPEDVWQYALDWAGPWMGEEELMAGGKKEQPVRRRRIWKIKMVKIGESKGTGRIVCSVLCRQRWPMMCYDTGDMGTLRPPVSYGGDRFSAFRISGNAPGAFGLLGGVPVWSSEFAPPLRRFMEYQIAVDRREDEGGAQDVVELRLVPHPESGRTRAREMAPAEAKQIESSLRQVLETLRDDPLPDFVLRVATVHPSELKLSDTSLRLRRLVDLRGAAAPTLRRRARSRIHVRRRSLSVANPAKAGGSDDDDDAAAEGGKQVRFADPED